MKDKARNKKAKKSFLIKMSGFVSNYPFASVGVAAVASVSVTFGVQFIRNTFEGSSQQAVNESSITKTVTNSYTWVNRADSITTGCISQEMKKGDTGNKNIQSQSN